MTSEAALARLLAGNARFAGGTGAPRPAFPAQQGDVQAPFAMVLCCADSRVGPEDIFDQGLGDLFVCRVAGNVLEPAALGSFEFALTYLGTPAVLLVLGHQRCGAVTATVELTGQDARPPGSIGAIVDAIAPVVRANRRGALSEADYVDAVVRANARAVAAEIARRSAIVRDAVAAGRLALVAGRYDLDTGTVELLANPSDTIAEVPAG